MKKKVIIALGGNAIQNKGEKGTYEEQYKNVYNTMKNLVGLIKSGEYEIVITHGNGPQVGTIMIQQAAAKNQVAEMPMFACGAMSQGEIGLLIQQSLNNLLKEAGIDKSVATVVTQTEVDAKDPGFQNPTKPVGPFYTKEEGEKIMAETGTVIKEDAGRGYRRVVPSPEPINIIEIEAIKDLIDTDNIVVASGGGGIPVIRKNGLLEGVDAVIDKDRAAALLGDELNADLLVILTAVNKVALNYGKENEQVLQKITVEEAKKYMAEGHFAEGSMKPKIEACIKFIEKNPARKALITHPEALLDGMDEKDGTWITM